MAANVHFETDYRNQTIVNHAKERDNRDDVAKTLFPLAESLTSIGLELNFIATVIVRVSRVHLPNTNGNLFVRFSVTPTESAATA